MQAPDVWTVEKVYAVFMPCFMVKKRLFLSFTVYKSTAALINRIKIMRVFIRFYEVIF